MQCAYRPTLKGLKTEASALDRVIGRASNLADSVSCKVRVLDQAKVVGGCLVVGGCGCVCVCDIIVWMTAESSVCVHEES